MQRIGIDTIGSLITNSEENESMIGKCSEMMEEAGSGENRESSSQLRL